MAKKVGEANPEFKHEELDQLGFAVRKVAGEKRGRKLFCCKKSGFSRLTRVLYGPLITAELKIFIILIMIFIVGGFEKENHRLSQGGGVA